jgi:hypothetical protein
VLAAHVGSGETDILAQKVHQGFARFDCLFVRHAVHAQFNGSSGCHQIFTY